MDAIGKLEEYSDAMMKEGLTGYALSIKELIKNLQNRPESRKEDETDIELRKNCESIRNQLELFAQGALYDSEKGEMVYREDIPEDQQDDERYQDFYSYYISDNLGIKVMHDIQSPSELFACNICVAWGGPNIYINTYTECVEGYWGYGSKTSVAFSKDVTDMVDEEVESLMRCYR